MPAFKSQHYVPKVYLRNFSDADHRKTVSLYNIQSGQVIGGAPIKSQCASSYLYGNDDLENVLGDIEGRFAEWVNRGLLLSPPIIVEDLNLFLNFFVCIQYMRTAAQIARMQATTAIMTELMDLPEGHELRAEVDKSDSEVARENVMRSLEMQKVIEDLGVVFLRNNTSTPFMTSDHPVVSTNRFYIQRLGESNFGFGSAGAIIYTPLSPEVALLHYDNDVYSVGKDSRNWKNIKNYKEINLFNDLVFLNSKENIYSNSIQGFDRYKGRDLDGLRVTGLQEGKILTQFDEDENGRFYAESEHRPETGSYIIGVSQKHPAPARWPQTISFRRNVSTVDTESGAGYLRRRTANML